MSGTTPDWVLWEESLRNGAHWSGVVRRGTTLRILALELGANVSATFFNCEQPLERYNMADTLKAQHTAFLTKGHVCYSDMGRVLCSITEDTGGWMQHPVVYLTPGWLRASMASVHSRKILTHITKMARTACSSNWENMDGSA